MSVVTVSKESRSQALGLLASLRALPDADANLVLLASQKGVTYREIAEAWNVAPEVIARRIRAAMLRMREATQGVTPAS